MRPSRTIFDQERAAADAALEAEADLTREFWGEGAGWVTDHRTDRVGRIDHNRRPSAFQIQTDDHDREEFRLDHTPTSIRAIRDGLAAFRPKRVWRDDSTGPVERTRAHGIIRPAAGATAAADGHRGRRRPSPDALPHSDASIGELAAGRYDPSGSQVGEQVGRDVDDVDGDRLVPLTPVDAKRRPGPLGRDPMVIRLMILALAVIVAIPLALALRGDGEPTVETDPDGEAPAVDPSADPGAAVDQPAAGAAPAVDGASAPEIADDVADAPAMSAAATSATAPDDEVDAAASASEPDAASADDGTADDATADAASSAPLTESLTESYDDGDELVANVDEQAEREPECALTYTAAGGDSWYRIADGAGVTPAELVQQNQATIDTVILPGDEVCLPDGATMPTPPPAVDDADTNSDDDSTTDTSSDADEPSPTTTDATTTTASTTTAAPTTTTAPSTTAAPATDVTPASRDEVQAMIREIWPEELHDKALAVADRESSFIATADNGWCCVGVFQIYWTVHRSWLDDYGITTRDGLKDARKNITAAYELYQRNGGWGPWGG